MKLQILLIALIGCANSFPSNQDNLHKGKCGYESCHATKDGFINVHIVPHTHDDVGWLKTVDQYYFGSNSSIQKAGVQYILDSVMESLRKDPNRRFIYVETAFFWKWWMKQHDTVKSQVRKFVKTGQLEFIGGGWTMNDEAVTHYQSIIDQLTWGLRKLNETFGECGRPKVGWQIDPFGHSREMASIFAQLGFDGLLLGRIDYQDRKFRFMTQSPEMVWQASDSLDNADLFTSVLYNQYSPPPGFCFDVLCDDQPIIDDKRSPDYNVPKRVHDFLDYAKNVSDAYKTNNVIITMGDDFNYQDANMWFKNLDKLILYANQLQSNGSKYNLLYSTPSCYLKAVHDEGVANKIKWNTKQDDFFPYASDPNAYWTGYFTSKPAIKRFERIGNNFLQVCKQLYALTDLGPEDWTDLNALREAMGVMQHHDAVTGTEKDHVAHDYARLLSKGLDECSFIAATALSKLVTKKKERSDPAPEIPFQTCFLANISQCAFTETTDQFVVTVYNPLSRPVNQHVRLPVTGTAYKITDPAGNDVTLQILPIHEAIIRIPGRESNANYDLAFQASDLPPLGFKSYYVSKIEGNLVTPIAPLTEEMKFGNISIKTSQGQIMEIKIGETEINKFENSFFYYKGAVGNNRNFQNRSSGAYIFRPNGSEPIIISEKPTSTLYKGNYITELHQSFNQWTSQIIRFYSSENYVEFDWIVGPIPKDGVNGKEIVAKYKANLNTESTFYTDSNGRELLKRVKNFRPTWKVKLEEQVAGNYYPVTSKILVRSPTDDVEMAVLTDRAQGGASLNDGEIELMVHRNCLHDDAFGVDESLDEQAFGKGLVVRGSHYLVIGPYLKKSGLAAYERQLAQSKILQAWTFLSPTNGLKYEDYAAKYLMSYSGIKSALPSNIQILTLEPWKGTSFLLRLEHILEKSEDPTLSQPATVNLKDLFVPFTINSLRETTLGANQYLSQNNRLNFATGAKLEDVIDHYDSYFPLDDKAEADWAFGKRKWKLSQFETNNINSNFTTFEIASGEDDLTDDFSVTLKAMQIRTFVLEIDPK